MALDTDSKKIIVLASIAVILLMIVLFVVFRQLFGSPAPSEGEQYATFPESSTRDNSLPADSLDPVNPVADIDNEPALPAEDKAPSVETETVPVAYDGSGDWRDEIVVNSQPTEVTAGYEEKTVPVNNSGDDIYSKEALVRNGLVLEYPSVEIDPVFTDPDVFYESLGIFPEVTPADNSDDCGEVVIPSSESAYERFQDDVDENEVVVCMGEAVANDCETAFATYNATDDIQASIYVTKRSDGACGVATAYDNIGYLNLCSIESVLYANTGKERSDAEWQVIFEESPGETFIDLINIGAGSNTSEVDFDCVLHKL